VALAIAGGVSGAAATAWRPAAVFAQTGVGQVSLAIGTAGPDAGLLDLDENEVSLLDFTRGTPTLIEFFATWCENCEALQPQLDRIVADYGDRVNVVAVAVAVSQSLRRVRRHVEEHGHTYPYLWDARGAAVRAYEAATTSIVVILDAEGNVAYTGVGAGQDLIGAVRRVMGG
jgi:thiol-disulfide isomerase/thioredoxin